jgi:hypothetical protein
LENNQTPAGQIVAMSDHPSWASGTPNFGHTRGTYFLQPTGGKMPLDLGSSDQLESVLLMSVLNQIPMPIGHPKC